MDRRVKGRRIYGEKKIPTAAKITMCGLLCGSLLCLLILFSFETIADNGNENQEMPSTIYRSSQQIVKRDVLSILNNTRNLARNNISLGKKENKSSTREREPEICTTFDCQDEARFLLQNMNMKIDPCDDFYHFACGNFLNKVQIPGDENKVDILGLVQKETMTEVLIELRKKIQDDELDAFKKLKLYYKNCMNESQIEKESRRNFLTKLKKHGDWPVLLGNKWTESKNGWIDNIIKSANYAYMFPFPAIAYVGIDPKNTTKNLIRILNARTIISRTYFLDSFNGGIMDAYYDYMVSIAMMLGANRNTAVDDMKDCLQFEIDLYNIKSSPEEMMDLDATYNPTTAGDLIRSQPGIPWRLIFDQIAKWANTTINDDEVIILNDPTFLAKLENLIKLTPSRTIANYLGWLLVYDSIDYLPNAFLDRKHRFSEIEKGLEKREPKISTCVNEIFAMFPASLSALYVRRYFDKADRAEALELVLRVKQQFQRTLEELDWMDNETRTAALKKIDAMDVYVGYSDELFDDQELNHFYENFSIKEGSYLDSAMNFSQFIMLQHYQTLRKPVVKNDWTTNRNAAIVNAYYYVQKNSFEIPAGFLRRPFYHSNRPKYLNFGALGSIVGHEITHGFDNEGRKNDKDGNQVDWWQTSTKTKYLQKAECIIDQYSNFIVEPLGIRLNGKRVEGENIADNGGFKTAYLAYEQWLIDNGLEPSSGQSEPLLPDLNFTTRQLFWISAANNWCSKSRPEHLRDVVIRDPHSPSEARVTLSLANIDEFARDFHCPIGSRMNPKKKCVVW
ncbi:hypothetical protein QAD02_010182 [Eretmocerus hayati]|uniref:Uncharacterized protein n=1 Tax=Eretmocerus hayati TaxID=131215 RepID=A0ACC2NBT9_9HYME|nr:hypothetical protein QAD02_010182 [Eretmocerus hayati]